MRKQFYHSTFLLLMCLGLVCCTEKPATGQTDPVNQTKPAAYKPPLGVAIPKLEFADDVRKYIHDVLNAPIPAEYKLPADILATNNYDLSVKLVNEHFPEFVNKESDDLLRAVRDNPERYQEMMIEARSVREYYHPGSSPKARE